MTRSLLPDVGVAVQVGVGAAGSKEKTDTLAVVASGRRHAIENAVLSDYKTAMRLVADGVVKAKEHLVVSAILADRKDNPVVVCSAVQSGPVQQIVKRGHRVVAGIITVGQSAS